MAGDSRKNSKILLSELNAALTCTLCGGYFIDATTLVDCLHNFCRSCILKHFETKCGCPTCNKKKTTFRPDPQIQALVYKMVPGLYSKEMQRREEFFRSTAVRASSSCSDDSVLGDLKPDQEKWTNTNNKFFSPDDSISLSLEYYQYHLDETGLSKKKSTECSTNEPSAIVISDKNKSDAEVKCDVEDRTRDRRYLQCPAAVSMSHLQKFVRMKYGLTPEHKVDIIYEGEVLPENFNLMDVAYTFNWSKVKPMRFFYRIFTPMKIQPIKIINTTSSTGSKQLQIVPVKPNSELKPAPESDTHATELEAQNNKNKERLMAHLKLQRHKPSDKSAGKATEPNCVYEYEEPDKEEIKRFAENRDREWARMRQEEPETHHVSKKRKKNKHSKSDVTHKKRKIHAEITGEVKQELKLKVKLTPHNGHKHKHHRTATPQIVDPPKAETSSKDKLLQTRPVRHKPTEIPEPPPKLVKIETPPKPQITLPPPTAAQKTFLKTFQSDTDSLNKTPEKVAPNQIETRKEVTRNDHDRISPLNRKIAILQQCKLVKATKSDNKKPTILNTGFTVSKIETGAKRKPEPPIEEPEKRPSLEITLINPQADLKSNAKRPPPATIPLERIKKSIAHKTGVTIIPKMPDAKKTSVTPLDLSKPHRDDPKPATNGVTTLNGIKTLNSLPQLADKNHAQLSNLQMLSKVASEHSSLKNNKPRPQIPNLQTLKTPNGVNNNLARLPKLNEINKSQFRLLNNSQMRRPTQNQSIRNIPNPSLLVRQQTQNRLNATAATNEPTILNGDGAKRLEKRCE